MTERVNPRLDPEMSDGRGASTGQILAPNPRAGHAPRGTFRARRGRQHAMSSGMENLATGEGPVKREREEIKAVNNQGNSLPRKKFYRARAHCNPLSDSQFPVCVPATARPHRRRRLVVPAPSRAHPLTSRASRARTAREPGTFFVARLDRQPNPFGRSTDDAPRLPRPSSPTTARSIRPSTTGRRITRSSSPRPRRRTRTRRRPSFDSRTSGADSADCSFGCRRCFRTISPWVRLGSPPPPSSN